MSLPVATPVVARVPLRKLTVSSPSSGPTRLRVPDLLHVTDQAADDVLSGRCDQLLLERYGTDFRSAWRLFLNH